MMMLSGLLLLMSLLPGGLLSFPASGTTASPPPPDVCSLKGSVYVTDNPNRAHFYVFVEEFEGSADLSVYPEENKLFADQPGLWYYTEQEAFSDFVVYFTDNKSSADFSIYYTDVASFAGCR